MNSLWPLAVCCISLISLQILTPTAAETTGSNRSDLLDSLLHRTDAKTDISDVSKTDIADVGNIAEITAATKSPPPPPGVLRLNPSVRSRAVWASLAWARPEAGLRSPRKRRHAHSGSRGGHHYQHHGQLMRVGCVLGTCQVQNLSHRLYQLIGQSGREDSSPINPRSPHSYG